MDRDPELSDRLLTFAGEWWEKHVVRGEMPEVDGTADCSTALTLAAGEPDGETGSRKSWPGRWPHIIRRAPRPRWRKCGRPKRPTAFAP